MLQQRLSTQKRKTFFRNFNEVKTVALLFNATNQQDFDLVKRYVHYLKEEKKKVKAIGYFDASKLPEFSYSRVEYAFFDNRDLNWHLKPLGNEIDDFINKEFDLLIDLNIFNDFPLYYIAVLSKAKFKIGRYKEKTNAYDLMIEFPGDKGIKYFLRNIDHYLLQINQNQLAGGNKQ